VIRFFCFCLFIIIVYFIALSISLFLSEETCLKPANRLVVLVKSAKNSFLVSVEVLEGRKVILKYDRLHS